MSLCHYVNKVFELTSQHEPDNATIVFVSFIFFISLKKTNNYERYSTFRKLQAVGVYT